MVIPPEQMGEARRTSAWRCLLCQPPAGQTPTHHWPPRQEGGDLHTPMRSTMKRTSPSKAASAAPVMTAADAVIATLVAHGIEAIYALPGLQNDPLFDALHRFSGRLST